MKECTTYVCVCDNCLQRVGILDQELECVVSKEIVPLSFPLELSDILKIQSFRIIFIYKLDTYLAVDLLGLEFDHATRTHMPTATFQIQVTGIFRLSHTAACSPSLLLLKVSTSMIHVYTCINTHLPIP